MLNLFKIHRSPFVQPAVSGSPRSNRALRPGTEILEARTLLTLVTIDFEDVTPGTPLWRFPTAYVELGVNFNYPGTNASVHEEVLRPEIITHQTFPARSGTNVLFSRTGGLASGIAVEAFGDPWSKVGAYVTPRGANTVTLVAFASDGTLVGTASTRDRIPAIPNQRLEVVGKDISYVVFLPEVTYPPTLFANDFALDDFYFDPGPVAPNLKDISLVSATHRDNIVKFEYQTLNYPGPFTISLYQSADPYYQPSDTLLASKTVTPPANAAGTGTFSLVNSFDPAHPYVLVVADPPIGHPQGAIQETNEANNATVARLVTQDELLVIMPNLPLAEAKRYIDPLNRAMDEFQVNTFKRISAFLSQVAYESSELKKWVEDPTISPPINSKVNANGTLLRSGETQAGVVIDSRVTYYVVRRTNASGTPLIDSKGNYIEKPFNVSGPNFERYDNRRDLGNLGSPDGEHFRGRGPIQVTGRDVYTKSGNYLGLNLIQNYQWVSDNINHPDVGFRTTAYWWGVYKSSTTRNGKNLTAWADSVDPSNIASVTTASDMITRIVKGLLVGQTDSSFRPRLTYFRRALKVLGV